MLTKVLQIHAPPLPALPGVVAPVLLTPHEGVPQGLLQLSVLLQQPTHLLHLAPGGEEGEGLVLVGEENVLLEQETKNYQLL